MRLGDAAQVPGLRGPVEAEVSCMWVVEAGVQVAWTKVMAVRKDHSENQIYEVMPSYVEAWAS